MQRIEISDADYERLKALAEPFVDTPATVIGRLLDRYSGHSDQKKGTEANPLPMMFTEIPPLTHAKFLDGNLDGKSPEKKAWDAFLVVALNAALEKLNDLDELRKVSGANLKNGRKEDEGYKYLAEKKYSYQGVSAEDAMKIVQRLCKYFDWRC
ncbi:hypothetical protein EN949_19195, partial [Mesorhizobium sp. M7A.F.Ca.US.007.01.2.1]